MINLGQFIKNKRETSGLSLKALSVRCGISDTAIQRIETGQTSRPCWESLCKIAKELKIHPFVILKEAGYITDADISPSLKLERLDELDCSELQSIQDYIDFVIFRKNNSRKSKEAL